MAAETVARADRVHAAPGGFLDILPRPPLRAQGEVEPVQRIVKTHAAFVKCPVAFEDVGLAGLTAAESPQQRHGQSFVPVR